MLLQKLQELSKQDKLKSSQKNNCRKSYLDPRKRFEKKYIHHHQYKKNQRTIIPKIVIKPTIKVNTVEVSEFEGEEMMKIKPKLENALNNWYNLLVETDYINLIKWYVTAPDDTPENVKKEVKKAIKLN